MSRSLGLDGHGGDTVWVCLKLEHNYCIFNWPILIWKIMTNPGGVQLSDKTIEPIWGYSTYSLILVPTQYPLLTVASGLTLEKKKNMRIQPTPSSDHPKNKGTCYRGGGASGCLNLSWILAPDDWPLGNMHSRWKSPEERNNGTPPPPWSNRA